ncbi:MAG: TonB-dependent receptor [Deltaproteobacteria bacterium]|nr:TonB-dependent receptor [Deltaproteobacteria bacterium]
MPLRLAIALWAVGLVAPGAARGQAAEDAPALESNVDDDLALGDVVVTGTRSETPLADSPARVEVISREQIDRSGARDVAELLEEQIGIVITRSFRGDAIQLGGLDPEYTLILVDGDRAPGRLGGGIDLGRYTIENVERIEVLRGPGSALYGSDAIGGVVNILTRRATRPLELEANVQGGLTEQSGTPSAMLDVGALGALREGPTSLRVTGGYHLTDAFRRPGGVATSGSARDQWELGARGTLDVDDVVLDGRVDYLVRRHSGVDQNATGAIFDRVQLGEQLQVGLGARYDNRRGTRMSARASYSLFREQYLNDQRGSQALDDVQDNREHLGQLTLQLDQRIGDHQLTVGYEQLAQLLESQRLTQDGQRVRIAPFVQDEWALLDDDVRLDVIAGARFDADSQFGTALSPRVGVRFDPVPQLVMRATYGMGFRAPSFQELLLRFENPSVGYVVNGNPNLGPERSHGLDVSVEWTPIREVVLTAAFYRNDLEGMIATVTLSDDPIHGTRFSYANLARAYTQGIEARAAITPIRALRLLAGYALLDTRDEAANRPLENRPAHRITASAQLAHHETGVGASARFALSMDRVVFTDPDGDGTESAQWLGAIAQLDLRVSWAFLERLVPERARHQDLEVSAGADNVLDAGDAYLVLRPRTYWLALRGRY